MTGLKNNIATKVQIGIAFSVWCYIIYRALFIPITQDEAHTYLLVKTYNWKQALATTNTHWLNSLFMRLFLYLPGEDHLWKLRMFSILSWILYSVSVIRIGYYFKNSWVAAGFFIVAILNPYLIFYFSLARGYGAACAFIMLSLLMTAKHIRENEMAPAKWVDVFFAAAAATLANFSAFYFYLGLLINYILYLMINRKINLVFRSSPGLWQLLVAGTLAISIGTLFVIRTINELAFPGHSNVIDSLFGSLIKSVSYFDLDPARYYKEGVAYLLNEDVAAIYRGLGIVVALLTIAAIIYFARQFFKTRRVTIGFWALLSCLGIILVNIFLHICFKTPYLFERAALIFYPPLVLGLFCFFDSMESASWWMGRGIKGLTVFLIAIFGYNFYKGFSLKVFPDWPIQTNTKQCLGYLEDSKPTSVGINIWQYSVLENYYSKAYPGKYNFKYQSISDETQRDSLSTSLLRFEYLLLSPPYNDSALLKSWDIKLAFPGSGTRVLKRKAGAGLPGANHE